MVTISIITITLTIPNHTFEVSSFLVRFSCAQVFANTTALEAVSVHGTNPQNLIEKIMRMRIYACMYWKESCFGLTAETLVDKAMDLTYVGGSYGGNQKPSPFICLILKMLQIQPDKEIVLEFIKNEDYKCVHVY